MAVNSLTKSCDKISSKYSSHSSRGNTFPSNYLVKLNIATEGSSLFSAKSSKDKKNKSPYLTRDSAPFSKVIEKKILHRKAADFVTSFPLAANLYKANSDEFKIQKNGVKKVKKSVLTLPNMPATIPKTCTVSDMNDSEYFNKSDDDRKLRAKKRFVAQKKCKVRKKDYEFYDRDARYCSQMNINLDCSSTDIISHINGDSKRVSKKKHSINKLQTENKFNAHDVWAVLRNINRFQFRPSPPMSEESIHTPKKKKIRNKKKNRINTRVIETRRTEEFAYITKFEIDRKSPSSFTQSSSFDRITVIAKQDEFNEMCNELEKNIVKPKTSKLKKSLQSNNNQNKISLKSVCQKEDLRSLNKNLQNLNGKLKLLSNNNGTSIINDEHKQPNDKNEKKNQDNYKYHNFTANRSKELCTLYSGSSKGAINIHSTKSYDTGINTEESSKQLEKMSKVMNNDQSLVPVKQNEQKRRLRLVTTMPSAATMPKLTQTEIRRRLAHMQFPIVILGKDQLGSNSFVVMNYEPPQFMGLENNIWPFMQEWFNQDSIGQIKTGHGNQKKNEKPLISVVEINHTTLPIDRKGNLRKVDKESPVNKPANKEKNAQNNCDNAISKKTYQKRPNPLCELNKLQPPKKPKSMHMLKDKMLKLLYKKDPDNDNDKTNNKWHDIIEENINEPDAVIPNFSKNIDSGVQTVVDFELISTNLSNCPDSVTSNLEKKKLVSMSKYPWAKTKWASDFIENVVRKVRCGVYYNNEKKYLKSLHYDTKEASIQTILKGKNIDLIEQVMQTDNYTALTSYMPTKYLDGLPGFGEGIPLEIKTLNVKEVAVKHCTTNVMVQFDVTVPSSSRCLTPLTDTTSTIIPLTITESKTMVFKCQTAILNAMLPAEICSILPKIMKSIIDSKSNVFELPCPPATVNPINSLCTVSETALKSIINNSITATQITISPIIIQLLEGSFSYKIYLKPTVKIPILSFNYSGVKDMTSFMVKLPIRPYFPCNSDPYGLGLRFASIENGVSHVETSSTCTALQVYQPHPQLQQVFDYNINTSPVKFCFTSLLEQMWTQKFNIRFKISSCIVLPDVNVDYKKIFLNVTMEKVNVHNKEPVTSLNSLKIDSIYNNILSRNSKKSENSFNLLTCKVIENKKKTNIRIDKRESQTVLSHIKTRKKSFVKLYRKCKSTTNISGERSSTSLSKITNLDEFFQALGSGKIMSSIFDGQAGSKILTAIMEMKSWIKDISRRQAMLVLLLTNKKDTPNLVRFRPILLQGIAVNRITRASELDMEIEVIERENFNKFSQYEGVRYQPEVIENNANLLEELYWIAKTTASDYQKPFNEASEKLLKTLLEKRKKLNPSYLRVMARYVGLGLLNTSNKN